jgi:hypothetical protein
VLLTQADAETEEVYAQMTLQPLSLVFYDLAICFYFETS